MIFAAMEEAASRGELILVEGGLCRWHRRRDGIIVIREILVLPHLRRKGIASKMLTHVLAMTRGVVQAKCPVKLESNEFWKASGFTLVSEKEGINLWQRPSHG
jgi:GNAT superfamily N-acetyltransferase